MSVQLKRLEVQNFKKIGSIDLPFPSRTSGDEPSVLVIGGNNGSGKTSIIECCALVLLASQFENDGTVIEWNQLHPQLFPLAERLPDLLIKSGEHSARIVGELEMGDNNSVVEVNVERNGICFGSKPKLTEKLSVENNVKVLNQICRTLGYHSDPILEDIFILFHSFRKIKLGPLNINNLIVDKSVNISIIENEKNVDVFKKSLFGAMFENFRSISELGSSSGGNGVGKESVNQLKEDNSSNSARYLKSKIKKFLNDYCEFQLKMENNLLYDFIVEHPIDGSISIDSLGSGHREILSTLFLVWNNTLRQNKVILIDEPELHINANWQKLLIRDLLKDSPQNQYILATHSERVMDAVEPFNRILLEPQ